MKNAKIMNQKIGKDYGKIILAFVIVFVPICYAIIYLYFFY
ncbi:hypothetical protein LY11_05093 [Pedobacter cryoconitis]|uniref:Uncharacterized protein n=1 Tax=Pedobacter cryoconitis TaxID=188932 RepID=A0A327RWS3_9SPHI|nr:hypothetical protein LY11_05093 [Pedobacter cryoconitis]